MKKKNLSMLFIGTCHACCNDITEAIMKGLA